MMGFLNFLSVRKKSPLARKTKPRESRQQWFNRHYTAALQERFDAALHSLEDQEHWSMADSLSAMAALSPMVREVVRNRARYETANNTYAGRLCRIKGYDCIGTGPRLQMLLDEDKYPGLNTFIEEEFSRWAKAAKLDSKLRTMRETKAKDGEAFALFTTNRKHGNPVELDIRLVEADHFVTPQDRGDDENLVDAIEFDEEGNPEYYHMLEEHPGGLFGYNAGKSRRVHVDQMIHWFRKDRPQQYRGISEIMAALTLFAKLRRYTLAVVVAAEAAADIAVAIKTAAVDVGNEETEDEGEIIVPQPLDVIKMQRGMATVLPEGTDIAQVKAEQPTTSYPEFKRELLAEIGVVGDVPVHILTGDSSKHNYSSGRLDGQPYHKAVYIDQTDADAEVVEPVFWAWLDEAMYVFDEMRPLIGETHVPHQTYWDGFGHVDPQKEAKAVDTKLKNGTATKSGEWRKEGKDWEKEAVQIDREKTKEEELRIKRESHLEELRIREEARLQKLRKQLGVEDGQEEENGSSSSNDHGDRRVDGGAGDRSREQHDSQGENPRAGVDERTCLSA